MADREVITSASAGRPLAHYSPAVVHEEVVYCSGVLGTNPETDQLVTGGVEEQTIQAIKNLEAVLREAGSGLDCLLKVTCYLADRGDFGAFDAVYSRLIPAPPPARVTVASSLVVPDSKIEIDAVAARRAPSRVA